VGAIWYAAALLALLVPIGIITSVIYLIMRGHRDQDNGITSHQVLVAYFYFVTGASVLTMAVGLAYFIRVAVHQAFDGGETASDLTLASVLLGTGLLVYTLHIYGRRTAEKRAAKTTPTPRRIYLFFMLGFFSIVGLISLPLAIYETIHYYIVETNYYREAPSGEIAMAIVFVLLWVYFIFRVFQEMKPKEKAEAEEMEDEHLESPEI
jgi:hypothetical protein